MMLENWSFRRDNLAVLNMIRKGLFGEIVHCHCAHSHNCIYWYFDAQGNPRWSGNHLLKRNADQYPTHSLGPVLSWMDINCGDRFDYLVSMATRSLGIKDQLERKYGKDHPAAKLPYRQGDIVTTMVKTVKGNTIVIAMDMQLPRPYDNRWQIQGTRGLYNEQRNAVYIEGVSPKHEEWEPFPPYQTKYEHSLWKNLPPKLLDRGHGGTDVIELQEFVRAVRAKTQTPIDVYDSVVMSVVVPLSAAVDCGRQHAGEMSRLHGRQVGNDQAEVRLGRYINVVRTLRVRTAFVPIDDGTDRMEMTPRQRWLALLERKIPDRIPTDYQATEEVTTRLRRDLDCADDEALYCKLHIDARRLVEPVWHRPPDLRPAPICGGSFIAPFPMARERISNRKFCPWPMPTVLQISTPIAGRRATSLIIPP